MWVLKSHLQGLRGEKLNLSRSREISSSNMRKSQSDDLALIRVSLWGGKEGKERREEKKERVN
jgi:hypothetical protein